jgi:hypothetical protein
MLSAQLSEAARDEGLAKLFATADFSRVYVAIATAAAQQPEITSDEVWTILEAVAVTNFLHPNAVGAAFRRAAGNGLITQTSRFRKSSRVSARRRNVQVWKSLLFVGAINA